MSHSYGINNNDAIVNSVMNEIDQVISKNPSPTNYGSSSNLSSGYRSGSSQTQSHHNSPSFNGSVGMNSNITNNMSNNSLSSLNSYSSLTSRPQQYNYNQSQQLQLNEVDRLLMTQQQQSYHHGHNHNGHNQPIMSPYDTPSMYQLTPVNHNVNGNSSKSNLYNSSNTGSHIMRLPATDSHNSNESTMNMNANKTGTEISQFQSENDGKLQLKDYVFISKDCTYRLGQYVVKENWGREYSLLYKYLDYIFRCQSFSNQIIEVSHHKNGLKTQFLIFHSGLQRRSDNKFLYVLLIPNSISKQQGWRVQFGGIHNSFLAKNELMKKLKEADIRISDQYLPQRTRFCMNLQDLLYDEMYSIQVNWEERLTTNQDRIHKVMGHLAFFDDSNKFLKMADLIHAFENALSRTKLLAAMNSRIAVPQGFVDTKHKKYRMELLLPLAVKFPRGQNGKYYRFALAIGKSEKHRRQYLVKSILTLEMAYANARLIGYVDSLWLCQKDKRGNNANTDINQFVINPYH